jgi:hypothetical protein
MKGEQTFHDSSPVSWSRLGDAGRVGLATNGQLGDPSGEYRRTRMTVHAESAGIMVTRDEVFDLVADVDS